MFETSQPVKGNVGKSMNSSNIPTIKLELAIVVCQIKKNINLTHK